MPRLTQSEIHSNFSSASETWSEYRAQLIAFYDNHPHGELNDHITREFNKKIRDLGQAESLYISPYNAGLRYIGDGVFTVDPLSFNPYFYIDAASSMLGVLESPSLDLNPAVSSTLDIITATRAGTATYTDASGNIQTASPNTVRVDHVQGEELTPTKFQRVGYTDFSSGWIQGGLTISDGEGLSGEVSKVVENDDAGSGNTFYFNVPTVEGQTYTGGFWIRRISGSGSIALHHTFSPTSSQVMITDDVTSEWTFVSTQFLGKTGGGSVRFGVRVYYTSGDSVEIAMPQVEEGTTASDFVANTTGSPKLIAAATYAPRVPMMLIEPAATNLIVNSEDFSQDVTLSNCTVQSGFTAPDASTNAYKLIEDNTNSLKLFRANNNTATAASTSYSSSIFVKAGERTKVRIYAYHLTNQFFAVDYDLISNSSLGEVPFNTQVDGHSIEDCGNGWKRITVTGQKASTYSWDVGISPLDDDGNDTYQGDGTSGVYIWGAQLEEGTFATSYIPTAGSAVTRAADELVIDGSDFTDFYNQSEGTIYVETLGRELDFNYIFSISDGSSNNRIVSIHHEFNHLFVQTSGTLQGAPDGGTFIAGTLCRYAASFKQNNLSVAIDGGNVTTDTSATLPTVNKINIGSRENGNELLNGHIKRVIYWPHHSDNI